MIDDAKHLTADEKTALAEIERRVSALFDVRHYILFGSKARGDALPDSDIDLLIITGMVLDWRQIDRIIGEVYETNLLHGTLFTAHTIAAQQWESGLWDCLPLKRTVADEGINV